jgi:capsular polysaccharide export protein
MAVQSTAERQLPLPEGEAFLRIPPFPGSKVARFSIQNRPEGSATDTAEIADLIRDLRVGGTFWAAQPELPPRYILVRTAVPLDCCNAIGGGLPFVRWLPEEARVVVKDARFVVTGDCDPWHLLSGAAGVIVEDEDELRLIAALLNVPTYVQEETTGKTQLREPQLKTELESALASETYVNPFTGEGMSVREAIELCGFWRRLIDKNRELGGGLGFAFWKQDNVGALMWGGAAPFQFLRTASEICSGEAPVAVWRSKAPPAALAELEAQGRPLVEVEDGFLRSQGLGADCVPPLSITVDGAGTYFDPAKPSELEGLLQNGVFDESLIDRARRLRRLIVDAGLSKYSRGDVELIRRCEGRRHILVPGQVEDDRSVQTGGCGLATNLDLLIRVREQAPDAYILYKPHPDVVAGHRKGAIPDRVCLQQADEIASDAAISSLIAMVDEVHVNTSLAGFEALMRQKPVTTYGVPFYSGWGLTRDLGPVPARRSSRRTLDELVAATLLLYPRYLDPETGLPCPPEVVVARLSDGQVPNTNMVVTMRRLQGKLMRGVRSLVQ